MSKPYAQISHILVTQMQFAVLFLPNLTGSIGHLTTIFAVTKYVPQKIRYSKYVLFFYNRFCIAQIFYNTVADFHQK